MTYENLADKRAYLNTFGCFLKDTSLIDNIDKPLNKQDFDSENFYQIVYVAFYNLMIQGCVTIDVFNIDSYLSHYDKQYEIWEEWEGIKYLTEAKEMSNLDNYDYHYHRLKKYSLLRYYEKKGLNTSFIYNRTLTNPKDIEKEETKFDEYTEKDIVDLVDTTFVATPSLSYCSSIISTESQDGNGLIALVDELEQTPDVGVPLKSEASNTVCRGMRLGCVFMRSSSQGCGKTRMAVADACNISIPYFYNKQNNSFIYSGIAEPSVFISTEMTIDEIQTIVLATVSGVNEEHILFGQYEDGEKERIKKATEYIEQSPLYIVHIPDFSIEDIKKEIKKYRNEYGVNYFFFDYIHTSLRLMAEVNSKSGMGLKEHQLLLVFITELKNIAQQLNVFILTSSQLNGEASSVQYKDQNLLSGAKALANKLDVGMISLPPNSAELKKVDGIIRKMINKPKPNMCHWIYKVRRGKLTRIVIWCNIDFGTMYETPLFVTNYELEVIDMDFTKIENIEKVIKTHSIAISKVKDEDIVDTTTETIDKEDKKEQEDKPNKYNISW